MPGRSSKEKKLALEAASLAQQEYNTFRIVGMYTNVAISSKIREVPTGRYTSLLTGFQEMVKNLK